MLYCSLEEAHEVSASVVETVCAELREEKLESRAAANPMPPAEKIEAEADDRAKKTSAKAQNKVYSALETGRANALKKVIFNPGLRLLNTLWKFLFAWKQ